MAMVLASDWSSDVRSHVMGGPRLDATGSGSDVTGSDPKPEVT